MSDIPRLSEAEEMMSTLQGMAELTSSGPDVRDTLDAEAELWTEADRSELQQRLEALREVSSRTQLTDRQRAIIHLLRGRIRRHLGDV